MLHTDIKAVVTQNLFLNHGLRTQISVADLITGQNGVAVRIDATTPIDAEQKDAIITDLNHDFGASASDRFQVVKAPEHEFFPDSDQSLTLEIISR